MATATAAKVENPVGDSVPNDVFPTSKDGMQPPASSHGSGEESKGKSAPPAEVAIVVENDGAVTIKKMGRVDEIMSEQLSVKCNTGAERLDSSEPSQERKKMDIAKRCGTQFYERLGKSELLQIACNSSIGMIVGTIILDFTGKGDKLPISFFLALLAVNLCFDAVALYGRKWAEKMAEQTR